MNNKPAFNFFELLSFTNIIGGTLLCLFIGSAAIYPYFLVLEIPFGHSFNSIIFCTFLGFCALLLFVLPYVSLFTVSINTIRIIVAGVAAIFVLFLSYNSIVPNETMGKLSGLLVKKAHVGNQMNHTTFVMKPKDCQLLKSKYKFAEHYLFEDTKDNLCLLQNSYEVYISNSENHLLMLPPSNEDNCLILTIRREDNFIRTMRLINKKIIEKVLPNAKFPRETNITAISQL